MVENLGIKVNKELIGNLIVFLSERCKPLYHTKLLKLLYLIDEESVKRCGSPITWLDYKVWKWGPVSEDVYFSKFDGTNKFAKFVNFDRVGENQVVVHPKVEFDDGEFSDYDMEVVEDVLKEYGAKRGNELVEITHLPDSLWSKIKNSHGLHFSEENKTSDVSINFLELLDDDEQKKACYREAWESLQLKSVISCPSK